MLLPSLVLKKKSDLDPWIITITILGYGMKFYLHPQIITAIISCCSLCLFQDQCLEEEDMFFVAGLVSRSKRVLADIECIGWEK